MEEYRALREEVLRSMQTQQASLSFGAATIGILAAGGFNAWEHDVPAVLVFIVGIPTMSGLVALVWLGELTRMQRAGAMLVEIEAKVNAELQPAGKGDALCWETALRERGWKLTWNYQAIMASFAVIAVGSLVIGVAKGFESELSLPSVGALLAAEVVVLVALGAFVVTQWRRSRP
jgi:hypothetical protein